MTWDAVWVSTLGRYERVVWNATGPAAKHKLVEQLRYRERETVGFQGQSQISSLPLIFSNASPAFVAVEIKIFRGTEDTEVDGTKV